MRTLIIVFLSMFSSLTLAGGDYWEGRIIEFQGNYNHLKVKFKIIGEPRGIITDCEQIEIKVNYKKSFLDKILFFIKTVGPTVEEHQLAVDFLRKSHTNKENTYIGYIAGGLESSSQNCTFKSKGLKLESIDETENIIFSYP